MYVKRRVKKPSKAALSLWDPRTAGRTMPEPIINHGYFVGTSGLGLWDPRTAGRTMPEPRVNRAYVAGVVYDAAHDDYPRLKNPRGIAPSPPTMQGLGGYGRGCGCGGLSGCASCGCPRCRVGLPCNCNAPVDGMFDDAWTSIKSGAATVSDKIASTYRNITGTQEVGAQGTAAWNQFPNPVIKSVSNAPNLDPQTVTAAEIGRLSRQPAQVKFAVAVVRGGWHYLVDPTVLRPEVFATIAPALKDAQARVTPAVIAEERKRVGVANVEMARQDALDAAWEARMDEKYSLLNLLKTEWKNAGANLADMAPTWLKVAAGVGVALFAANIYLNYLKTKQLVLKSRESEDKSRASEGK